MEAEFTCISQSSVTWFYDNDIRVIGSDYTLYIPWVNVSNQGHYECQGATENGIQFRARATLIALCKLSICSLRGDIKRCRVIARISVDKLVGGYFSIFLNEK